MLLEDKVALIHGAGGSIGGAVARTFAHEGARVFLAGRTESKLEEVADGIRSDGPKRTPRWLMTQTSKLPTSTLMRW